LKAREVELVSTLHLRNLIIGKLLVPKVGMLRLLCNTILRGKATDCWILPVSVQYDRVIETETYVDELLGKPKEKESLKQLITGGGGKLQLKLGISKH
jgi:glycerol-3-phosphate O-acyltransferase